MTHSYPAATPHGPIVPVAGGVHCVRGTFRMGPGLVISRTMTIVEDPAGLVLVNSVRLGADGEAELAKLGRVAHVVTLADGHGLDDPYYVQTFGASFWTAPGARPQRLPVDRVLGPETPITGARAVMIPNPGSAEAALWLPHGGGTLVTCDALQNHVDTAGASWFARIMTPILGFKGGVIVPKMWRKVHRVAPKEVAASFAAVADLSFENLVTGHGPPVIGGADRVVRSSLAALAGLAPG